MDGFRRRIIWIAAWCIAAPVLAADIPWKSAEYFHAADKEPLVDLLRSFAADQAIPMILSESMANGEGDPLVISGRFGPMAPEVFLDKITASNGLVWYYDGSSIYIYRSREIQTQLVTLNGVEETDLRETLADLQVLTDRFPLRSMPKYSAVYVAGPPRYLELVQKTLDLLKSSYQAEAAAELDIEVVELQYAWADDTTFFFRNTEVTVPGVATVLTNLMSGRQTPGAIQGASVKQKPRTVDGLRGQGLLAVGRQPGSGNVSDNSPPSAAAPPTSVLDADGPVILPDRRLNAVIIRDLKERLPAYRKLIQTLDVPTGLVEIEATIIDVDTNSGFEWGPPAEFQWKNSGVQQQANLSLNATDVANFAFTLLRGGQTEFLARIKALETEGAARVVSRPSVLTVDNVEAHLDNTQTFYVRVAGDFEVDLFDVTVGTSLRITPHIVDGPRGGRRVKLIVHVEDGRATDDNVDGIPRIAESTVDTQAILNEDESLLIGGLMREEATHSESRVPFLGRIPKVGYLFKTVTTDNRQLERLIMVTPRLIELPVHDCCPDNGEVHLDQHFDQHFDLGQPISEGMSSPIYPENQSPPVPFDFPLSPPAEPTKQITPELIPSGPDSMQSGAGSIDRHPMSHQAMKPSSAAPGNAMNPIRPASMQRVKPAAIDKAEEKKSFLHRTASSMKSWTSRFGSKDGHSKTKKKSSFFKSFKQ